MSPVTLNYADPTTTAVERRLRVVRKVVYALAIGSTLWGILCALLIYAGGWLTFWLFAPGYLVTAGYFWRAVGHPSLYWCRTIWIGSALVQGAWLLVTLFSGALSPVSIWWLGATAASVICLFAESDPSVAA